ncbi:hypothetical protein ERUR111494_01900 [Erysipelothrix urinaevulpis]|uniref:hypothetical protein n=1 Tax=Erysipelothrix urinaevulpis TaxID=2683717 RepID=UPI00135C4490|nr:hypothetical protein [Erysipelothrix urinaevulpis]
MSNLTHLFDIYKDKNHKDYLFAKKIIHKILFFGLATCFWIFIVIKEYVSNNPAKQLWLLFGLFILAKLVIEVVFSLSVINTYSALIEDENASNSRLAKWMSKRFWKYYNKKTYGWKFMGSYNTNKSYTEGAYRGKRNASMGDDFIGAFGPALRITKATYDPFFKRKFKFMFENLAILINTLNHYAAQPFILPEEYSLLDDFNQYKQETSNQAYYEGQREFDRGYYDAQNDDNY